MLKNNTLYFKIGVLIQKGVEMFGYMTDLRSAFQGRATYSMEFDHYEEVPTNVATKIREDRGSVLPDED